MRDLSETEVRAIHKATSLEGYSIGELQSADQWVKRYALNKLKENLKGESKILREYIGLMARCNYGSMETDAFLQQMRCYPDWIST